MEILYSSSLIINFQALYLHAIDKRDENISNFPSTFHGPGEKVASKCFLFKYYETSLLINIDTFTIVRHISRQPFSVLFLRKKYSTEFRKSLIN